MNDTILRKHYHGSLKVSADRFDRQTEGVREGGGGSSAVICTVMVLLILRRTVWNEVSERAVCS